MGTGSFRRGAALCVLIGFAAALLGGCGYRPLYGNPGIGSEAGGDLADVGIAPIADRRGQILHNALRDRMNPAGQPTAPKYLLRITLQERRAELGIRIDETATRANLLFAASFQLIETETGAMITQGRSTATTSFNILTEEYGTIRAEDDARQRGVQLIAENIEMQVALYLNRLRKTATAR